MTERHTPVQTYRVDYICDECGKEPMRCLNTMLTTYPPKYSHVCDGCGAGKALDQRYPTVATVPIAQREQEGG